MPFFIVPHHLDIVGVPLKVQQGVILFMPFRFLEPPTESLLYQLAFFSEISDIPPEYSLSL